MMKNADMNVQSRHRRGSFHGESVCARDKNQSGAQATLDTLEVGGSALITAVGGRGMLRRRLLDMGLTPKTRVKILKAAPLGDPIVLRLRGYDLTIRREDTRKIEIGEVEQT